MDPWLIRVRNKLEGFAPAGSYSSSTSFSLSPPPPPPPPPPPKHSPWFTLCSSNHFSLGPSCLSEKLNVCLQLLGRESSSFSWIFLDPPAANGTIIIISISIATVMWFRTSLVKFPQFLEMTALTWLVDYRAIEHPSIHSCCMQQLSVLEGASDGGGWWRKGTRTQREASRLIKSRRAMRASSSQHEFIWNSSSVKHILYKLQLTRLCL